MVPLISINEYFDLTLMVLLGAGVIFELPVLIFFLTLVRDCDAEIFVGELEVCDCLDFGAGGDCDADAGRVDDVAGDGADDLVVLCGRGIFGVGGGEDEPEVGGGKRHCGGGCDGSGGTVIIEKRGNFGCGWWGRWRFA